MGEDRNGRARAVNVQAELRIRERPRNKKRRSGTWNPLRREVEVLSVNSLIYRARE